MAIERGRIDPQGVRSPKTAAYGLVPPGTANYQGVSPYRPDWADWPLERRLSEATAILGSLGYTTENPLVVEIRYNGDSSDMHQQVARDIAENWSRIGVKAQLFPAESAAHFTALRTGDFDIGRLTWILDFSDPANVLGLMQSMSEFNVGGYRSQELDAILMEASKQTDLATRALALSKAEAQIVQDAAIIPLNWIVVRNLISSGIEGIRDNAKNVHPTRWIRQ
jgi:oligopeptide transport system substrate-binding protein